MVARRRLPLRARRSRVLRSEWLEPRMLLSGSGLSSLAMGGYPSAGLADAYTAANSGPTVAQAITVNGNAAVTGKTASLLVLGSDPAGKYPLSYTWSITSAPAGGSATFNVNGTSAANNATATFNKAGVYTVAVRITDAAGLSVTSSKSFSVSPTVASITASTAAGQAVAAGTILSVSGVSQSLVLRGFDQFGNALAVPPAFTWSTLSWPSGASVPGYATSGGTTTITFGAAGYYQVSARVTGASAAPLTASINVNQTLTSLALGPNAVSVLPGANQQFTARALNQFGQTIAVPPTIAWSASSGTINGSGLFTAPASGTACTVAARSGSLTATAAVTILPNPGPTVTQPITVNGNAAVTGRTATLTVLGSDAAGASAIIYTWSITSAPSGGSATFSVSGTNVANYATATFNEAGAYTVTVKIADPGGLWVTNSKSFVVSPTLTSIAISPNTASVLQRATQQFTARSLDQFGQAMASPSTMIWSATSGTINASGLFTAPASGTSCTVAAMSGSVTGMAAVTLTANPGPTVTQPITVNGNQAVSGKTATLTVLGSDAAGASTLIYTWSMLAPSGGSATFSASGTNAASSTTATFTEAGTYTVSVTIVDAYGLSAISSKTFVVSPTLTSIALAPNTVSLLPGATQQFTATSLDQFGQTLANPPIMAWSATSGTINASGLFTAPASGTSCTVAAMSVSGSVTGTATVSLLSAPGPTVTQPITVNGNQAVTGKTASLKVLGSDSAGASTLLYTWSITSAPAGASTTFNVNGTTTACNATATFNEAGAYTVTVTIADAAGLSATSSKSFVVSPTLTSITGTTPSGQTVTASSFLNIYGISQALILQGFDQFGNALATPPAFTWSTPSGPANEPAPIYATSGSTTTITFAVASTYIVSARVPGAPAAPFTTTINVDQTLTSIVLSPNTPSVLLGATQQFTADALDQFGQTMWNQQTLTWSATSGTINAFGVYTAPATGATCTVTVVSGKVTGTAAVTLAPNPGTLQDPALATLVKSLDADGSISRLDMIQILRSVEAGGTVSATDFYDLKEILYQASALNIPSYVQVLAADVVNGNQANATYQGQPLGNLAAGSTATQLDNLVSKWFFGTDHPTLCNTSLTYQTTSGSLFPHAPSHADEFQGGMGDCYFISAMGTLADSNPAAVQNMFVNNGDGTYTVRFYTGNYGVASNPAGGISAGFTNNLGMADYVTVDSTLPAGSTGILAYADYGSSCTNPANSLWIPLAEKAYAQWNQTGKEGRDDTIAFASIQGGWMATVDAQVLGHNATDYIVNTTSESVAVAAVAANKAVTIGTLSWSGTNCGLYAGHAYAIIGYSAATDTFTLYNPWGMDQPGQLTWTQLQSLCSQMAVCDTSGSIPVISALPSPQQKPGVASAFPSPSAADIIFATGGPGA